MRILAPPFKRLTIPMGGWSRSRSPMEPCLLYTSIVANWIPLEEPSGGPNFHKFSDDVLYQVHIAGNASGATATLADTITYNIRFTTAPQPYVAGPYLGDAGVGGGQEFFAQLAGSFSQTYSVTQVVTAPGGGQTSTAPPPIKSSWSTMAVRIATCLLYTSRCV